MAESFDRVLTPAALDFVETLERAFRERRDDVLGRRAERRARVEAGEVLGFLAKTRHVRFGDWRISQVPRDLLERKVEITGPTDRKMMINALNSGASAYMADFEDSCAPTWENVVSGQANLIDAVDRTISFRSPEGKDYRLAEKTALLMVRPRGWHLVEKHHVVDGRPCSASLFDFGLYLFHNHARLRERGTGPYFYLPKLESHEEARLWNDVFLLAQKTCGLERGTIRATVLIETIHAAFEMDEILFELREHAAGLNVGRWDYIFSIIKTLGERPEFVLPNRGQVGMGLPFLRAYAELLVKTCHRRGAHAIGGMSACIPNRRDPEANEAALAKVREDKAREAAQGFDGAWVAHPDLVPVVREELDRVLGMRPNQVDRWRESAAIRAGELLDVSVPGGSITESGLRQNVSVALRYLCAWLSGTGAVALDDLMEDTATAEISRSQVWQWIRHAMPFPGGGSVTRGLVEQVLDQKLEEIGKTGVPREKLETAAALFRSLVFAERCPDFLTLQAYEHLD